MITPKEINVENPLTMTVHMYTPMSSGCVAFGMMRVKSWWRMRKGWGLWSCDHTEKVNVLIRHIFSTWARTRPHPLHSTPPFPRLTDVITIFSSRGIPSILIQVTVAPSIFLFCTLHGRTIVAPSKNILLVVAVSLTTTKTGGEGRGGRGREGKGGEGEGSGGEGRGEEGRGGERREA